jgi:exopolysaccharide production protein ExoZ
MNNLLRKNFDTVQLLRGIAASIVVFFHVFGESSVFKFGAYGVDLFFVLSGFIILYIHHNDIGVKKTLSPFLIKRFVRIFPIYWVVTFGYVVLVTLFGHTLSVSYIIKSLLLLPQDKMPVVGVAWTLEFELLFYLIFSLLIFNRKIFYSMFCLWGLAIVFFFMFPTDFPKIVGRIFNPLNLEFLFGCGIALIVKKTKISFKWITSIGILSIIVSILLQYYNVFEMHRVLAWGIPFTLLILGLVKLEMRKKLYIPKILLNLGDASYSIYLSHLITLLILESTFERLGLNAKLGHNVLIQFILCIIAIFFGWVFYSIIEKPILKYAKLKIRNINKAGVELSKPGYFQI